jgi:hypothetical protein
MILLRYESCSFIAAQTLINVSASESNFLIKSRIILRQNYVYDYIRRGAT